MSIREKRKQERRQLILDAAAVIFDEVGFSRATMDEIAERAGVGVATVYKYFGSKAGIVQALVLPDLTKSFEEGEKIIANPPANPGEAMSQLIDCYWNLGNNWSNRRLLRALSVPGVLNEKILDQMVGEADAGVRRQVRDLLLVLKVRGSLDPGLSLDDATSIIFSVFNQHYVEFVTQEDIPTERMAQDIRRRIKLLFPSWEKR